VIEGKSKEDAPESERGRGHVFFRSAKKKTSSLVEGNSFLA